MQKACQVLFSCTTCWPCSQIGLHSYCFFVAHKSTTEPTLCKIRRRSVQMFGHTNAKHTVQSGPIMYRFVVAGSFKKQ
jgi:hypothetical protein